MSVLGTVARACAVILALAVVGCGGNVPEGADFMENMTEEEAAEKVREHIDNAMSVLLEGAELEERHGMKTAACDDPTDGGPKDRVTVSERLWVRGLPVEDNEENVELLYEYWTANGYRVVFDQRPEKLSVSVEHEEDAFRISIRSSDEGSLSLCASSPCVRPEGTPGS